MGVSEVHVSHLEISEIPVSVKIETLSRITGGAEFARWGKTVRPPTSAFQIIEAGGLKA
jgi:hypothetical protein